MRFVRDNHVFQPVTIVIETHAEAIALREVLGNVSPYEVSQLVQEEGFGEGVALDAGRMTGDLYRNLLEATS